MNDQQQTIEAAVAAMGSKVTYAGSAGSILGWMASSQGGVVIGITVAIIGLLVNVWFKAREDRRQQEEHNERMRLLHAEGAHHE
jgi:hypothetical protein